MQDAIQDADTENTTTSKVALIDAEIKLYAPMKDGGKYIALIAGMDFAFRGKTPMAAHQRADTWRKGEWEKITSKAARERHVAAGGGNLKTVLP